MWVTFSKPCRFTGEAKSSPVARVWVTVGLGHAPVIRTERPVNHMLEPGDGPPRLRSRNSGRGHRHDPAAIGPAGGWVPPPQQEVPLACTAQMEGRRESGPTVRLSRPGRVAMSFGVGVAGDGGASMSSGSWLGLKSCVGPRSRVTSTPLGWGRRPPRPIPPPKGELVAMAAQRPSEAQASEARRPLPQAAEAPSTLAVTWKQPSPKETSWSSPALLV